MRGYSTTRTRVAWEGLDLSMSKDAYTGELSMEMSYGYRPLGSLPMATRRDATLLRRGNQTKAAAKLRAMAQEWLSTLDVLKAEWEERIASAQADITRTKEIVDGYVFPQEWELRTAMDKLDAIEAQMMHEADTTPQVAAAA